MTEKKPKIKVAPHSKESEMMVLGCMLTSLDSLNVGSDGLDESDFYFTEHKILFQVLKNAYRKDKPADMHLVCEELRRIEKLEAIGGVSYVATLAQYAGTSAYIEEYVEIVRSKSILRKMIYAAETVEKTALEEPADVHTALDEAQNLFFKISQVVNPGAGLLISDLLGGNKGNITAPVLKTLQERQELFRTKGPNDTTVTGIPSHFIDMDKLINGLNNSNLIILAARPAMGKTAFALNIAENVCFKNNFPVGIFSLEMTAEQLLYRLITSQAEVESDKIRTGNLTGVDFQRIVSAVGEMQKHTMVIDDQPGLKITDLRARARRMKEAYGIRLLIIDYLQLLSGSSTNRNMENRQNEISEISRMLKTLARELDIPIICLSQLSRKVEDRPGHRPLMSDLRESGCLAGDTLIQDATTGAFHTIKQLAERKEQTPILVYALSPDLKLQKQPLIKAFYSGKKQLFSLTTKSGRSIKASANHPFYKLQGWTRLDELKIGDRIALPRQLTESDSNNDTISEDAWEFIVKPAKEKAQLSWEQLADTLETSYNDSSLFKSGISRSRMSKLAHILNDQKLLHLAESEILWDEITSIEKLGIEDVYDATIDNLHNFVANDILAHNSIEQDSDIVMFLLRREYYDPNDKPGMAEVIVAKNRHGGIGTVNLTFIKEFAQFRNFSHAEIEIDEKAGSFAEL